MEAKVQIEIKDLEIFEHLVELINKHFDNLPKELQDNLKEVAENGISDIDADYVIRKYKKIDKIETNFKTNKILTVNKILKKVTYPDDKFNILEDYPASFFIKINDDVLVEW